MNDPSANESVAELHQRLAVGHCAENERRMNRVPRNEFAGRCDARVDCLNGLMCDRKIASDDNVQVLVVDLQHDLLLSFWRISNGFAQE